MKPLKVRASSVDQFITCPRMYYFAQVRGLFPKIENPKLFFGTGFHQGVAEYYKTFSLDNAVNKYREWLAKASARVLELGADPEYTAESTRLGEMLLIEYVAFARVHDDFSVLNVETKFEVPVWDTQGKQLKVVCPDCKGALEAVASCLRCDGAGEIPVVHTGTFDAIVRDNYGKLRLMEHKTAKDFPTELSIQLNMQLNWYILALNQLFDEPIHGAVYNITRKVNPMKARTPVVKRMYATRTDKEVLYNKHMLAHLAEDMLHREVYPPHPGFHCGWKCAYVSLCTATQECLGEKEFEALVNHGYVVVEDKEVEDNKDGD